MTESRNRSWLLILPAAAVVALAVGLRSPSGSEAPVRLSRPEVRPAPELASEEALVPAPAPQRFQVAPDRDSEREVAPALLETSYRNFRYSIATENQALSAALRPALLRNRKSVLKLAQDDVNAASPGVDRDIAVRTLEALRR